MSVKAVLKGIAATALLLPFVALFAAMFLGPPAMLIVETVDLLRMRSVAQGVIDAINFEYGSKGSRAKITYHFEAAGRTVVSERYVPGYHGNIGRWTGGASIARDF